MRLSFTIAAGPRQRSHSRFRVPRDSWPHFTVSDSRLPQPGGPGPRIYIPQEQGGPVIPPGTEALSTRSLHSFEWLGDSKQWLGSKRPWHGPTFAWRDRLSAPAWGQGPGEEKSMLNVFRSKKRGSYLKPNWRIYVSACTCKISFRAEKFKLCPSLVTPRNV
jgi:hypothetical protein